MLPETLEVGDLVTYRDGCCPYGYSLGPGIVVRIYQDLRDGDRCSVRWSKLPETLLESVRELRLV